MSSLFKGHQVVSKNELINNIKDENVDELIIENEKIRKANITQSKVC